VIKRLQQHFVYGDYRETQDLHGALQANKARDCTGTEEGHELILKAPDSGRVERVYKDSKNPKQNGFHFVTPDGKDILFHHANPAHEGKFVQGEHLGGSAWHHFHVAFKYQGQWHDIREILPINEPVEGSRKMQSYPVNLLIHTHNTEELNIRKAPSTKSDVVGKLPPKSSLKASELVLDAELVSGVSTWYRIEFKGVVGYISGAFVDDVKQVTFDEEKKKYGDQISALETKLLETNQEVTRLVELVEPLEKSISDQAAQIETLTTKIDNQSKELTKFNEFKKSVFYALFLIFNRKR